MNERIQQFAEQARTSAPVLDTVEWIAEYNRIFAELIVQECAQVAHNTQYKHSPAHTVGDCATAIKEHFGVGMSTEDKKTLIKELLGVKND